MFKRTKLWGRANKAAQEHLRNSECSKRKVLTTKRNEKIRIKSKHWFQKNKPKLKEEFREFCKTYGHKMNNTTLNGQQNPQKLANNHTIRAACLNVRGFNKQTKREIITDIMRRNHYDIMLLSETNANCSSWENWKEYVCSFSSSIDPKIREQEMKKKEEKKGQGKGKHDATRTNYRNAQDFENAGVAIVIKRTSVGHVKNVKQIDGRIIKATFAASGSDVSFFAAYAPHTAYDVEAKETFYDKLSDEILNTRGTYYIGGDFNARLHYVRNIDKEVCGTHILGRGMAYLDGMSESTKENGALFLGFCKIHALNVQFPKPPHKLITYKEKCSASEESQDIGPPYDAQRFAQIDFWLAKFQKQNIQRGFTNLHGKGGRITTCKSGN